WGSGAAARGGTSRRGPRSHAARRRGTRPRRTGPWRPAGSPRAWRDPSRSRARGRTPRHAPPRRSRGLHRSPRWSWSRSFVVRRLATLPTVAAVHARPSGRRRRGLPRRLAAAGRRAGRGPGGAVVGRGRRGIGRAALARAPDAPRSGRERLGRGRGHRAVAGEPVLLLERAQRRDGRVVPRPRDLD